MALKILEIFSRTDAKSRMIIVVSTLVGIVGIIYALSHFLGGGATATGSAHVANAPSDLQSVPGGQLTPEYSRALAQENAQAAQKAQSSGGSSVATLVNVDEGNTPPATGANCSVVCPGADSADVTNDVNNLVKSGKLTQTEANTLLDMAKDNVPVTQYADSLNELVRQGKVTPEQARKLLSEYTNQHANALVASSAQSMDGLIKSGKVSLEVGTALLDMQKKDVPPTEYEAELNRLVREGKITPDTAAQLLAQYTQQKSKEAAAENAAGLQAMVKSGEITADVANDLAGLQKRNVPAADYEVELNRLVANGKLTPAAAAKLLSQYRAQRTSMGPAVLLNSLAKGSVDTATLNDLVSSGKITAATATALAELQQKNVTPDEYQKELIRLGVPPDAAQKLMAKYKQQQSTRQEAQKLMDMQSNNVSAAEYTAELTRAVKAGLLTPEMAAKLQQEYNAMITPLSSAPPTTGTAAGVDSNLPGNDAFSKLQQRIAAQQQTTQALGPSGVAPIDNSQQFADAAAQASSQAAAAAEQARQQRIQGIMGIMAGQAKSLVAAWQPVAMVHKGNSAPVTEEEAAGGKGRGGLFGGLGSSLGSSTTVSTTPVIKAGTILFATLDTAVNSDFPDTPIMATVITGQYKGAKLLGKITLTANNVTQSPDRVSLTFNTMDTASWVNSQSITAFAIDPQTARTVMASNVDYHYFKRYGAMMGNAFLSGYSSAISNAGATTSTGIFGTTTTHPELSPLSKFAVGLGQVGTTLGTATANYINTPPTVRVNAGVGLGILFMSDVTLSTGTAAGAAPPGGTVVAGAVPVPVATTTTTTTSK
jgi:polyhydroxyalkanoate synthesis regulator phasin